MFRTLLALAAVSLVSSLCLDAGALLCVDWSTTAGVVTFNSTCSPYQGSATTWCAFGVAATKPLSMFPADVAAVVSAVPAAGAAAKIWVEDRANVAFAVPQCFAVQTSVLTPGSASVDAHGVLRATWSRPATLPAPLLAAGYVNLQGPMFMIAASSTDSNNATLAVCDNTYLPVHTFAQTAIAVTF